MYEILVMEDEFEPEYEEEQRNKVICKRLAALRNTVRLDNNAWVDSLADSATNTIDSDKVKERKLFP